MSAMTWHCDAHDLTTDGDCARCDDELAALTEETAGPRCHACGGGFEDGEDAYASDWHVIDEHGVRFEVRYEHVRCVEGIQP